MIDHFQMCPKVGLKAGANNSKWMQRRLGIADDIDILSGAPSIAELDKVGSLLCDFHVLPLGAPAKRGTPRDEAS
jgi:hypothetical protein